MNWVGDLVQKQIKTTDSVLDLGCGIMQSTMNTCSSYPPTRLCCGDLLGVDKYEAYLEFLQLRGIKVLKYDLRYIPLPFEDGSWDHVLLLDVLEHMPNINVADQLFDEAKRIARKRVFVVTPKTFFSSRENVKGYFPSMGLGVNRGQLHHCFLSKEWLIARGLKVLRGNPASRVLFAVYGDD